MLPVDLNRLLSEKETDLKFKNYEQFLSYKQIFELTLVVKRTFCTVIIKLLSFIILTCVANKKFAIVLSIR